MEQLKRSFKGIWIPKEIWLSSDLTLQEKVFLVEIDSLDNDEGCYANNNYFAEFFGLSPRRCSTVINSLEKKGYITSNLKYKENTKEIEKRILKVVRSKTDTSRGIEGNDKPPMEENYQDNNINNNNINIRAENKKRKNNNEKQLEEITLNYSDDLQLRETIRDFIKMRKEIKKPITPIGLKRLLNKLSKMSCEVDIQIEILGQSILRNWQDIYDLKNNNFNRNVVKPRQEFSMKKEDKFIEF